MVTEIVLRQLEVHGAISVEQRDVIDIYVSVDRIFPDVLRQELEVCRVRFENLAPDAFVAGHGQSDQPDIGAYIQERAAGRGKTTADEIDQCAGPVPVLNIVLEDRLVTRVPIDAPVIPVDRYGRDLQPFT